MEQIFLTLLNISITASWIVLAVVLLRFVLKKAPKWTICLLWAIVGLRLIMPFSLESVFSLLPDKEVIDPGTYQVQTGFDPIDNVVNSYLDTHSNPAASNPDAPAPSLPEPSTSTDPISVISQVWLAGVVLMALYSVGSWLLLRRRVAEAIPFKKGIYFCDRVDSAFILGVIRPRIYLPFNLSANQIEHIVCHEQAHLTRRDHLWKPLGFVLLSIYWFNPVMWLAYILLCRDIELACDEKAIRYMDTQTKQGYSETLLACSTSRRMITACPVAFGEVGIKGRIKSVADYKRPAFWVIVIALICCIAVAVCFLTDPAETPDVFDLTLADQEKDALVETYYTWRSTQQGVYYKLAWADFSDTAEKGPTYSGYRYYGTFGDCIVWFRGDVKGTATEVKIADSTFKHPCNADYYVNKDNTLYTLQQAYEQGLISAADVAAVAKNHADYNAAAAENPKAALMELPLTPEKEQHIKQVYLNQLTNPGSNTVDNLPLRVISNYNGVCAVWIGKSSVTMNMETTLLLKKPSVEGKFTGSYVFTFPDSEKFRIYANDRVYGIETAYEEGILTPEHVELLLEGNRYLHKNSFPVDWKS